MNLYIDADTIAIRAAMSSAREFHFEGTDQRVTAYRLTELQDEVDEYIEQVLEQAHKATGEDLTAIICLTDLNHNFRKDVYPEYKANRKKAGGKPAGFYAAWVYLRDSWGGHVVPSLEADDVIGVLATRGRRPSVVCSIDKDLLQIPSINFNPDTEAVTKVTRQAGRELHLLQALIGDRVDGYPGCPGVGAVTGKRLLETEGYSWDTVVAAYEKKGLTEEYALGQARCAKILTSDEVDSEWKVMHWTP